MKNFLMVILAAAIGGIVAIKGYETFLQPQTQNYKSIQEHQAQLTSESTSVNYSAIVPAGLDFTEISKSATKAVVHIKSTYEASDKGQMLFYQPQGPSQSSGSGVIVTDDGYIITNNHVVDDAKKVQVVLDDNRSYEAEVIGTDPTTDLALIKIDQTNLDFMRYGNSDEIEVGQWVLAVGNPFNLTSTVTAGIVSAKARNIGILRDKEGRQVESFIQTDAAVNPGNSGGALINIEGNLIGINTAIASQTGSFAGYSFAVPINLAKKVIDDLLEFGVVQRGLLGIKIISVNAELAEQENIELMQGVYVDQVGENSAAEEAGIKAKDIIVAIDDKPVTNTSELQELVARRRPGDKVGVSFIRKGVEISVDAILKNAGGTIKIVEKAKPLIVEGSVFEEINEGVQLKELKSGKWKDAGIDEGFIIKMVDNSPIDSIEKLQKVLSSKEGKRITILGMFPNGDKSYYAIEW